MSTKKKKRAKETTRSATRSPARAAPARTARPSTSPRAGNRAAAQTKPGLERTRDGILDAARRLVAKRHPSALSVAEIAAEAGVSHRTVYRYFPTKEELISAVAQHPIMPELPSTMTWADTPGVLRTAWHYMANRIEDLRGERVIPEGVELRRARLAESRAIMDGLLASAGLPAGATRDALLEIVVLLSSSTALLELVDRHGHDVDTAVDLTLDAIQRLVASALAESVR